MNKIYLYFKNKILLNTDLFSFEAIPSKCKQLKELNLIDYEYKIKNESTHDFFELFSNYTIRPINSTQDIQNLLYHIDGKCDLFKSIVFQCFPLYACIKIKDKNIVPFYNFEELLIIDTLSAVDGIINLPKLNDKLFTALFLLSLYQRPGKYIEYKNFIFKWHIKNKGIPLPEIEFDSTFRSFNEMFTFFIQWVDFFYN